MNEPRIVNVSDLPWTPWSSDESLSVEIRDPARRLGSSHSGFRLYRLAPGKQATRLHRHHHQEEMYLILKGSGTLRHGEREVPVKTGDFILYPAGDPVAHTFINRGREPMEYLATGNRVPHEVCEYPEEGTVYVEVLDKTLRAEEVEGEREVKEAWYKAGRPITTMWIPSMDAVVSHWFSRYEEARAYLQANGGYLLPHGQQFFVTGPEGIRELGLDPDDPDWTRIGHDWVRPADPEASKRLWLQRAIAG